MSKFKLMEKGSKRMVEGVILSTSQEVTERAYEKFCAGELNQEELENIYHLLQRWTMEGQELLKVLEL